MKPRTWSMGPLARGGLLVVALSLFGADRTTAATFTVNDTADVVDFVLDGVCETAAGNGVCTLRAAVQEANRLADSDTIVVPAGTYTITIAGGEDAAAAGDLDLLETVTISGAASSTTIIDGNGGVVNDRVVDVLAGVATISGVTVLNGSTDKGGGIRSVSELVLTDVVVTENIGTGEGGGVHSVGPSSSLILTNVIVSNNGSLGRGGGIFAKDSGDFILTDVTVSGNSSTGEGGGIRVEAPNGAVTLTRVTVSGNDTGDKGGGIHFKGSGAAAVENVTVSGNTGQNGGGIRNENMTVALLNVTISGNSASTAGGGIEVQSGMVTLTNTIIANSSSGGNCAGTITDGGNNLADDTSCGTIPNTLTGLDPILASNGGPTQTHALLAGSSAIDGATGCPGTDQRNYLRSMPNCDVGAYEFGALLTCPVGSSPLTIEFANDDLGSPLVAGDVFGPGAANQHYALFGVTIELAPGSSACPGPAMIFDSETPTGGDLDLGSPNATCPGGGPGVGTGGEVGDFYENCAAEGNLLILSEDGDSADPDDCGSGGILRFIFDYDTTISEVQTLDVDEAADRPEVLLYDAGPDTIPGNGDDNLLGSVLMGSGVGHDPAQLGDNAKVVQSGIETIGAGQVRRMDFDLVASGSVDSFTFCKDDSFLPVTLASFRAVPGRGGTLVEWTTATETLSAGFNLYALTADGWQRVNRHTIPSRGGDTVEPQSYRFEAHGVESEQFVLEELDVRGKPDLHGPFAVGRSRGSDQVPAEPVDWRQIRREHGDKGRARRIARGGSIPSRRLATPAPAFRPAPYRPTRGKRARSMQLLVEETGLYRVTYEALRDAGLDLLGVPATALALVNRGRPVSMRVEPAAGGLLTPSGPGPGSAYPGLFGPGGFIEFYGEALDTLYTRTNVYRLQIDPRRARRAAVDARAPSLFEVPPAFYLESRKTERNRQYNLTSPAADPWFDTRLLAFGQPALATVDFEVDELVAAAAPAGMSIELWGLSGWPQDPDHHLEVGLNGSSIGETRFDDRTVHELQLQLPSGLLREGSNTLELALPGDTGAQWDMVALDHFHVRYPRRFAARGDRLEFTAAAGVFRVAGLSSPDVVVYRLRGRQITRLSGATAQPAGTSWAVTFPGSRASARYLVSSVQALPTPRLEVPPDPAGGMTRGRMDYLIIAHPDFVSGLDPLVAERERQGLRVRVVNVEDVYQRFSHGIFDPEAIRRYIAFAAKRLGTEQVLLVGGDSYDYHDYLGEGAVSFLPSLYADTGDGVRFAPVDPLFADVDDDGVQDLALGRLPVRTDAELAAVIAKTLDYAAKGYAQTGVFAADAFDVSSRESFSAASDALIAQLPDGWAVDHAYIDLSGVEGAHASLTQAINAGVALTSFFGHSGPTVWSFRNLFNAVDAAELVNFRAPTVVTQWGCWNTYYVTPKFNTMAHKLLLSGEQGAVAVLGASTLTQTSSDIALGELLIPRLVTPGTSLGEALRDAKQELAAAEPHRKDVLLGWTLLGDPALVIEPPEGPSTVRAAW